MSESKSPSPMIIYHGMARTVDDKRKCQCETPLAFTTPIVADTQCDVTCISWCPFCGTSQYVTENMANFPTTAPYNIWKLDADKIYRFVMRLNQDGYVPGKAELKDLAWTFPQDHADGTFSINLFNIRIGRGLTVRAPESYIVKDEQLSTFDRKFLKECEELGKLTLIFPKGPAYANA